MPDLSLNCILLSVFLSAEEAGKTEPQPGSQQGQQTDRPPNDPVNQHPTFEPDQRAFMLLRREKADFEPFGIKGERIYQVYPSLIGNVLQHMLCKAIAKE